MSVHYDIKIEITNTIDGKVSARTISYDDIREATAQYNFYKSCIGEAANTTICGEHNISVLTFKYTNVQLHKIYTETTLLADKNGYLKGTYEN